MKEISKLLEEIEKAFYKEKSLKIQEQKTTVAKMVLELRKRRKKKFGLFVILGWRNQWNDEYANIPDFQQDIFAHHEVNIFRFNKRGFKKIVSTINFDGAILIDSRGNILHSGIVIEGLRPRRLAQKLYKQPGAADLSTRLGFHKKVHTRHLAAITASYELPGTTVFTVSEETGDVHIFEKGKIIFSTTTSETKHELS